MEIEPSRELHPGRSIWTSLTKRGYTEAFDTQYWCHLMTCNISCNKIIVHMFTWKLIASMNLTLQHYWQHTNTLRHKLLANSSTQGNSFIFAAFLKHVHVKLTFADITSIVVQALQYQHAWRLQYNKSFQANIRYRFNKSAITI